MLHAEGRDVSIRGLEKIVGKEISRIVLKERDKTPKWQLFLLFSDNTYFELYSDEPFATTKDVDRGGIDEVTRYLDGTIVFDAVARTDAEGLNVLELQGMAPITSKIQ